MAANDGVDLQASLEFSFDDATDEISCGFQLVRRVKPGDNWHSAKDNLAGSEEYGEFVDDVSAESSFSRTWNDKNYDQFLFATSDFSAWMIMSREAVGGDACSEWLVGYIVSF